MILPLALVLACSIPKDTDTTDAVAENPLWASLSMERIKANVDLLAGDDFAGRTPGSTGHAAARTHLLGELADIGLAPLNGTYERPFPLTINDTRYTFDDSDQVIEIVATEGINLAGILPGADPTLSEEYIVLMAHYDHIGVDPSGAVYNGAFDDITALASSELTDDERDEATNLIEDFASAAAGDSDAIASLNGLHIQAALFILFDLPVAHPGVVPPPWPQQQRLDRRRYRRPAQRPRLAQIKPPAATMLGKVQRHFAAQAGQKDHHSLL
jgi:hypothetical protein